MDSLFIARQPIMDSKNRVFAYEILFRGEKPTEKVDLGTVMSATTVNNLINVIGIDNVIGNYYGVIKITPIFIERKLIEMLPKERFIFALFEDDLEDDKLLDRLSKYKDAGYTFALNDLQKEVVLNEKKVLDLISYIKIDHDALNENKITSIIEMAKRLGKKTICTKIETRKVHKKMLNSGCDYFQGYFFSEPEVLKEQPIQAETGSILMLWNLIRNDAPTDELVKAFEREHAITLQLLRFINSPFFSLRKTVTSIRHLITLLGRDQLSQWLLVMLFAKESQQDNGNHPLVLMVINRTELMVGLLSLIKPNATKEEHETVYLIGMLSLIHLIFRQPHRDILKHLHVSSEIENALFEADNFYGELLNITRTIENNNIEKIEIIQKKYNISTKDLSRLTLEAMKKVNAFDEALRSMA